MKVAILGSGPSGLMIADIVSNAGYAVSIFEKRKGLGRKLLIAGSSGLNITNNLPLTEFVKHYSGPQETWKRVLGTFTPENWIQFIHDLGINTFEGTSGRYFVQDMKASKLLRAWLDRLTKRNVELYFDHECIHFSKNSETNRWVLSFAQGAQFEFEALCFCLGGGSYEPSEDPLRWPKIFRTKGLKFEEFSPSNVGYQVMWSPAFLKEAEGLPFKNIRLTSSRGSRKGDVVVTNYGIEGTPVYFTGEIGTVRIDLKPDLSEDQILKKCKAIQENLSPIRRVKKLLNLCPASLALVFHMAPKEALNDLALLIRTLKNFPLELTQAQPLSESISSRGGLDMTELDENFMLVKFPGIFAAGEMLNWDAPTGGFLIQGCVSQGYTTGQCVVRYLDSSTL